MDNQLLDTLVKQLRQSLPSQQVIPGAPLSRYTTLRLGGPADVLCSVSTVEHLSAALAAASELDVPVTIIGNGSNLLVKDGGISGLVIHLGDSFSAVTEPTPLPDGRFSLTAQAGATLQKLCNAAADHGLTGLEFAFGIPGTVGGAVYMNAGAYGGEMKDVLHSITAMDFDGRTRVYSADELELGYRRSRLMSQPAVVTSATVALSSGDGETIRTAMREFSQRRRQKQPIHLPSCGSTFKRPEGHFAGTLIEGCGLKGFRIGGASVSTLHAGFLVNDQEGTAADYLALIAHVQRTVLEQTGIQLEPEVRILGQDAPVSAV
ncbi:MAG: UDP-N-acetylmuramate dehydrogenase [Clostridiales bacterium]|nr:UDP-N-acetylmuramate dehydrogenase [Clostridiales bacterium]